MEPVRLGTSLLLMRFRLHFQGYKRIFGKRPLGCFNGSQFEHHAGRPWCPEMELKERQTGRNLAQPAITL